MFGPFLAPSTSEVSEPWALGFLRIDAGSGLATWVFLATASGINPVIRGLPRWLANLTEHPRQIMGGSQNWGTNSSR